MTHGRPLDTARPVAQWSSRQPTRGTLIDKAKAVVDRAAAEPLSTFAKTAADGSRNMGPEILRHLTQRRGRSLLEAMLGKSARTGDGGF